MSAVAGFDRCLAFINSNLQTPQGLHGEGGGKIKCVTISRQSGCGAHVFAEKLAAILQASSPPGTRPWTVFDRTLMKAVLQDHNLPSRLAAFLPEDRISELNDFLHQLFSHHPPVTTLMRQTAETILRLADVGNAIILGRGANIITARLPRVLHLRLIGSLEQRIAHMKRFDNIDRPAALERIGREDGGRERYMETYFGKNVDDPLLYHLVINTDWISLQDAAAMAGDLALKPKS